MASIFKTRKAKQFEYIPRYYNEEAERKKELEMRVKGQQTTGRMISMATKGQMFKSAPMDHKSNLKAQLRKTNLRVVLLVGVLVCIVYFMYWLTKFTG